ncbi:hypothetical protein [Bordetella tumulicola]|uniref:hypothetical protein n=1 Tax=Bordetella tumulicola TaxID=1649133 RepID=UPI0039EF0918
MLPKENQIEIIASSEISHPKFGKKPWTINRSNDFIFHTEAEDPMPEVVIRFSENAISTEGVIYLYNRYGTVEMAERLRGVQFAVSGDGVFWEKIDVDIGDDNIYNGAPIEVGMIGKNYLKIFRHKSGPPIHLSQITIGIALHEKREFDADLTRKLANEYQLPVDPNGHIIENRKRKHYISIRSSIYDAKSIVGISDISALEIVHLGRFSNALIQLCNALNIAKKLGVKKIYLPQGARAEQMFATGFPVICQDAGVEICIPAHGAERIAETILTGHFFYSEKHKYLMSSRLNNIDAAKLFKHGLGFDYGPSDVIKEDELVIHVRSGDIFNKNKTPHRAYGQPPFSYYKKIIDLVKPRVVHIVFEDEGNPVIGALKIFLFEKRIPMVLQNSSLREDIQKILKARSLVAGRGTFIAGIVSLSENIKTVYSFQNDIKVPKGANNIILDDVVGEFVENILRDNWSNSEEQRKLMLEYPVSALAIRQKKTLPELDGESFLKKKIRYIYQRLTDYLV